MIRARLAEVQLAVMLLTRLPAGRLGEPVPALGASVWAFPLAGLAVGAVGAAVLIAALAAGLAAPVAAGLALGAQMLATGGLHEDGLADLADGFWGGRERARRLEIMRDSRIGSYGTLALIVSVGLRWQAVAALAETPGRAGLALIAVAMTSRVASAMLLAVMPPARADGLGRSASGAGVQGALVAAALAGGPALFLAGMPGAMAVQALITLGLARLAKAKIGGQTGDVLGAAQQLAEIAALIALTR